MRAAQTQTRTRATATATATATARVMRATAMRLRTWEMRSPASRVPSLPFRTPVWDPALVLVRVRARAWPLRQARGCALVPGGGTLPRPGHSRRTRTPRTRPVAEPRLTAHSRVRSAQPAGPRGFQVRPGGKGTCSARRPEVRRQASGTLSARRQPVWHRRVEACVRRVAAATIRVWPDRAHRTSLAAQSDAGIPAKHWKHREHREHPNSCAWAVSHSNAEAPASAPWLPPPPTRPARSPG
jgi:hypothetical protein